jgi:2-polyprenyl-3-methyl-5-hydroxy-6-metoxy-1,4-benzoquinol methylase
MAVCDACGLVQAIIDDEWQQESQEIYNSYRIYHQSGGIEQPVFDPRTGKNRPRSDAIIEGLLQTAALPPTGRLLDIGCGNGAFLRACSRALPGWKLSGSEFNAQHRLTVESIPGVEKLHVGPLDEIPGTFDVISLIHVLEHIPAPTKFLKSVASKLSPTGWLLVEVPECTTNPFMLLVADHASHFSPSSLSTVVANAGFEVIRVQPPWVMKEISLVARPPQRALQAQQTIENLEFLRAVVEDVRALAHARDFGIFGTSIGATWLHAQSNRIASFFVDEDSQRIGKQLEGRPILDVTGIPSGAKIYIALSPLIATSVAERLRSLRRDVTFITPSGSKPQQVTPRLGTRPVNSCLSP